MTIYLDADVHFLPWDVPFMWFVWLHFVLWMYTLDQKKWMNYFFIMLDSVFWHLIDRILLVPWRQRRLKMQHK